MAAYPTLVLATRNPGKVAELQELLGAAGIQALGLPPDVPEVEEDGDTFEANALKKARSYAQATGLPVLAEDSGLEVDALGGRPGVHSARWVPGTDADRVQALLREMEGVLPEQRTARYVSVIALATPAGHEELFRGTLEGRIAPAPRGTGGFGYDPILVLPDGRTVAELTMMEKNRISHRQAAFRKALAALPAFLARAAAGLSPGSRHDSGR